MECRLVLKALNERQAYYIFKPCERFKYLNKNRIRILFHQKILEIIVGR